MSETIKLCFLIRSLDRGGAERQLVTLVKSLDKKKFSITVIVFYSEGDLEKELNQEGKIRLISLQKRGRWDIFSFINKLVNILKDINPDVIHSYINISNIIAVILKPFFPKTKIIWGIRASNLDLSQYDWLLRISFKLECLLSYFPNLIISNSHRGKNDCINNGFPSEKIIVISNGIDTEVFQANSFARIKLRQQWGISEDEILIGLVARLEPMKDHLNFLKAAQLLITSNSKIKFICIGKGKDDYTKYLHELAQELKLGNQLIWAETRNDIQEVYNAFDIFTLTSSYGEGFPNVIAEAMACGIPCVVTDVGDSALVVGETGIVVPPNQPIALVNGWKKILEMDRNLMAKQARDRIINNFTVNNLSEQTANIFSQIIAK